MYFDPLLRGVVDMITRGEASAAYLMNSGNHGLAQGKLVLNTQNYILDGYITLENLTTPATSFYFVPDVAQPDHLVWCSFVVLRNQFNVCRLNATYPYDPYIRLMSSLNPTPTEEFGSNFGAVAARLREIAICLDVTDVAPEDRDSWAEQFRVQNPTVTN